MSRPHVDVVGLGPGGPDLVTAGTIELLSEGRPVFLRTLRHPAASVVPGGSTSFDDHYESAATIDEVYESIVEDLVGEARLHGSIVYAVPGSPVVSEHTVELLGSDDRVEVVLHPALSFLDLTWVRLGVDPVSAGARLVDGHRFAVDAAGERGPLLVAQLDSRFVLSDVKLAVEEPPGEPVVLMQRLGLPDESIREVAWADLDRVVEPDHLTSLWIPRMAAPVSSEVARFWELMRLLRTTDPWKAEQTHDSLKRFLLEESYEVLEAVDAYDPTTGEGAEDLTSELGDLLYQVVFHAALGAEAGWFDLADVARAIHDKLVRRNEDLLAATGDSPMDAGVDAAVTAWEVSKQAEHGRASAFDGIPKALPALTRALKVQRKAEALGSGGGTDLRAAADALVDGPVDLESLGALLAAAVEAAQAHGLDPEDALRRRVDADEARFRRRESATGGR